MNDYNFKIGDSVSETKTFTVLDIKTFADLTGDYNPIHFDWDYAKTTIFERPIVHGPLVITLVTTLFAKKMPEPGSVYLRHDVKYVSPVYLNEEITATLKIIDITHKNHFLIETICKNQDGIVVIEGLARLKRY